MSRMIAAVHPEPVDASTALGDDVLTSFAALARVHADGWGAAWRTDEGVAVRVAAGRPAARTDLARAASVASTASLLYLRFGSAGSGASAAEAQPFLFDDAAFQHNGALSPPERLRATLTDGERASLRGTNDSELYFARVRRALRAGTPVDPERIADAVAAVRADYPDACLNALLLTPTALVAVHSSASRPAPVGAFASRGFAVADLPPGHGDDYNVLFTRCTASGARLVSTTGIPLEGWTPLPTDTVSLLTPDSVASIPLPRVAGA